MRIVLALAFLVSIAAVVVAATAFDPDDPRRFRRSIDPTEAPAGWVLNPDTSAVSGVARRYWKWNPGKTAVVPMTAGERVAEDTKRTRATSLERAVDAELRLAGLNALQSRMTGAGKDTTKIDARIAALDAALTAALADLP